MRFLSSITSIVGSRRLTLLRNSVTFHPNCKTCNACSSSSKSFLKRSHRVLQVRARLVPHTRITLCGSRFVCYDHVTSLFGHWDSSCRQAARPPVFSSQCGSRISRVLQKLTDFARANLSRDAALDSRGDPVWTLSAVTTSSDSQPIGCAPERLELRSWVLVHDRPCSVAVRLRRTHAFTTRVYVRVPRGPRRRWWRWLSTNVRSHFLNWSRVAARTDRGDAYDQDDVDVQDWP